MRRTKNPGFSLNVPHRRGAARLPRSGSKRALGVGWRGHAARDPEEALRTPSWVTPLMIGAAALAFTLVIVLTVMNPGAIRRPPVLLYLAVPIAFVGMSIWLGRRLLLGWRAGRRRKARTRYDRRPDA